MKSEELKGKRLAVFGANNVVDEVTAYARKHGIVLVSVGNVPEALIHQVSDEQYYMDCSDEAAMLRFFKEKHIDGLLSCSAEMVIRKSVGFIGKTGFHYYATPEQWDVLMNKQHFKEACLRYGMPAIPAFRLEDEDIPFPVIVKPVDNGGSFGVTVCHNRAEMEEAIVKAIQYSTVGDYLCEKFIEGNYFKIEVWKQNGRTYFPYAKSRVFYDAVGNSPRQPFIDLYPSFDSRSLKSLHTPLTSMLNSLEVTDGSCWFEGLVCNGIPYIFDTGFRLSGGMDFRVVREDKGIDLIACHMQYALTGHFGEDFFALNSPLHHCYATICIGLRNGVISHIRGIEAICQLPCVYSFFQYYHENDTIQFSGTALQVLCRIFVKAESNVKLKQHIITILNILEVEDENGHSLLLDYPRTWNIN